MTNYTQQAKDLNLLNSSAKKILKAVLIELKRFEGKKLLTQSGYVKGFASYPYKTDGKPFHYILDKTHNSIDLRINVFSNDNGYTNKDIRLGKLDQGVLTEIRSFDNLVIDCKLNEKFTAKGIATQIEKFVKQRDKLSAMYCNIDLNIIEKNYIRRY